MYFRFLFKRPTPESPHKGVFYDNLPEGEILKLKYRRDDKTLGEVEL